MLKRLIIILSLLCAQSLWAQMTPKKVDTQDLRAQKEYFSVMFKEKEKTNVYTLSVNTSGSFHLFYSVNNELKSSTKVPTQSAQKIDKQFADKFITMKYMLENKDSSDCSSSIGLSMRGEVYKVCKSDSAKQTMARDLIEKIKKMI